MGILSSSYYRALLTVLLLTATTFAQSEQQVELQVRIFDSVSGLAIVPAQVAINPTTADKRAPVRIFTPENNTALQLSLASASYRFTVMADGYRSMSSTFSLSESSPPTINFYLDARNPSPQDGPQANPDPATTRIRGVISDAAGLPCPACR